MRTTFRGSLPSHHLWPQRDSAKQIQNWSLHLVMHLNSTNSGDSPLWGTRGHCIRELSTTEKHTGPGARDPVRGSRLHAHFFPHDNIVEHHFSNSLLSGRLFENRFVGKPNHLFRLEIMQIELICSRPPNDSILTFLIDSTGIV